jgi:hypothetical protein
MKLKKRQANGQRLIRLTSNGSVHEATRGSSNYTATKRNKEEYDRVRLITLENMKKRKGK